jgi:DNA modification methylase
LRSKKRQSKFLRCPRNYFFFEARLCNSRLQQGDSSFACRNQADFTMTSTFSTDATNLNTVLHGDCVQIMRTMQPGSVDLVITDPPYITRYSDRSGRSVTNDDNARWLKPAFAQMHRLLKSAAFCISFYGWNKADLFIDAWRAAGFRIGGHLVFRKKYPSSVRFLRYQHEQAYLLVKASRNRPRSPSRM